MHIPAALKQLLAATPQWLPIGLDYPQEAIQVLLMASGAQFEVTANNVIAALKPLTVAFGLDANMSSAVEGESGTELEFVDRALRRRIGALRLCQPRFWSVAGRCIGLFEVHGGTQHCSGWPRSVWDSWMYRRAARKKTRPDSLALAPAAVEQSLIFYLCPRPVFLVSVDDGQHSNIFPMDLVGPIAPDRFTLALRNSSPSVETIKTARKVALSSIAAADHRIAYQLGAHHKRITIQPDALPFKMSASREFRIPIPVTALRVREVEIHDFQEVGSHTFFVGQVVSDDAVRNAPQLFHTCGAYQRLRVRDGRSFRSP
jgi:flavin reductase (DIM6/NTAB) family NADH-FMN oxidoreductase RutF